MKAVHILLYILGIVAGLFFIWKVLILREEREYRRKGESLVRFVEEYRHKYHRLPSYDEVPKPSTESESGPYYHHEDSFNYIIYFAEGFDDDYRYESTTGKWRYWP
jgi:hypothetical protein